MKVLILRTCHEDLRSYADFLWPESGYVEAPDWNPDPGIACGMGLHGALLGEGDGSLFRWEDDARWLVVAAEEEDVVLSASGGKVRFRAGDVVHCGDQKSATDYIIANGAAGRAHVEHLHGEPVCRALIQLLGHSDPSSLTPHPQPFRDEDRFSLRSVFGPPQPNRFTSPRECLQRFVDDA